MFFAFHVFIYVQPIGESNPDIGKKMFFFQNPQRVCGPHRASYSFGNGVLSTPRINLLGREFGHLFQVPRLRMSGAVNVLPPYAFVAWAGTLHSVGLLALVLTF
jgi:hypothetical protein